MSETKDARIDAYQDLRVEAASALKSASAKYLENVGKLFSFWSERADVYVKMTSATLADPQASNTWIPNNVAFAIKTSEGLVALCKETLQECFPTDSPTPKHPSPVTQGASDASVNFTIDQFAETVGPTVIGSLSASDVSELRRADLTNAAHSAGIPADNIALSTTSDNLVAVIITIPSDLPDDTYAGLLTPPSGTPVTLSVTRTSSGA